MSRGWTGRAGLCLVQVEAADRAQSFVYHKSVLLSTCLIPGVCDFVAAEPCGCDLLIPNNSNGDFVLLGVFGWDPIPA